MKNFSHRMKFKKSAGFEPVESITPDEQWVQRMNGPLGAQAPLEREATALAEEVGSSAPGAR